MTIRLHISRSSIEATAKRWGVTEYTVTPFDNAMWGTTFANDVMIEFAVGKVVALRERNGYDDSDFYVTYMDDHGIFREDQYATTRGWSYPCTAFIDASPELQERYKSFLIHCDRLRSVRSRLEARRKLKEAMGKAGVDRHAYKRLRAIYGANGALSMLDFLSKKVRSPFRISCQNQVRGWLETETPKHPTPLSPKQIVYIL